MDNKDDIFFGEETLAELADANSNNIESTKHESEFEDLIDEVIKEHATLTRTQIELAFLLVMNNLNKQAAARQLGIGTTALYNALKKPEFKVLIDKITKAKMSSYSSVAAKALDKITNLIDSTDERIAFNSSKFALERFDKLLEAQKAIVKLQEGAGSNDAITSLMKQYIGKP